MKKNIGIAKSSSKFTNYISWVEENDQPYIILDWEKNNYEDIKKCSSLMLTGGNDIFPEFYADWPENNSSLKNEFIPERDGFEFRLLEHALNSNMPLLGICRGMQLINCKLNGNLLSDIETIRGLNHKKINKIEDRYHSVNVMEDSLLGEIVGERKGYVNSSHHQGIDRVGEGLIISARAEDGIIEGLEWDDKAERAFLIAIQWHPERMHDKASPFSKKIIERFINETNNS